VKYVTFLRAINVAGHATVKMTDLKEAFASAGCRGVTTLIQSGNVLFECTGKNTTDVFQKLRAELRDLLNGEPEMVTRTVRELERMEEKELGVPATTRNWSTVRKIVDQLHAAN